MHRSGEPPGGRHSRRNRFVFARGAWYFTTREGMDVGPFDSLEDAEKACDQLLPMLQGLSFEDARAAIRDFLASECNR
jgi:hypothetical protein